MSVEIHPVRLGINRCYLIRDRGVILIDGGVPNKAMAFKKILPAFSIHPEEIQLIVLTHGDFDHVGSARDIKAMSGAKIAIHEIDKANLEQSQFNWPPGVTSWGKISRYIFIRILKNVTFPAVNADITLNEKDYSLEEFGIDGKVLYTPGHTYGSVSVLLKTGDAFVGCLAHHNLPFRFHPGLPIYAEDPEKVKESWKILIEQGARMIYPGHGNPFHIDRIRKYID
jgi:glyoxylase-like metal-dependent hydrolase (beta-lactamase superfamily II)